MVFIGYTADALVYDSGSNSWSLRSDYDPLLHRANFDISDDDAYLNGDNFNDEVGNDTNQTAVVTDMSGGAIDSGQVYSEEFYAVHDAVAGQTIWIERIEIDGNHVGYLVSDPLNPGQTYSESARNDVYDNAPDSDNPNGTSSLYSSLKDVPCFGPGSQIMTPRGPVPVEWIRQGDRVITRDHGVQIVRWVGRFTAKPEASEVDSGDARCIRIAKDAFGPDLPDKPLLLSLQHRVLMQGPSIELHFGTDEVLCAIGHLRDLGHITLIPDQQVRYHHILFDQHEIVMANGMWVESLFLDRNSQCFDASSAEGRIEHDQTARLCLKATEGTFLSQMWQRGAQEMPIARVA